MYTTTHCQSNLMLFFWGLLFFRILKIPFYVFEPSICNESQKSPSEVRRNLFLEKINYGMIVSNTLNVPSAIPIANSLVVEFK